MANRDRLDFLSENWNLARPEMDISPWGVWGRITRINELFLQRIGRSLRRHTLTYSEFQLLAALMLQGAPYETNPAQIAAFNLLTSGGLANLLGRMERAGLVVRRPDPNDGRGVLVRLTDLGRQHFNDAVLDENRLEHEMLQALTAEERLMLSLLLRKLLLSVDEAGDFTFAPAESTARRNRKGE